MTLTTTYAYGESMHYDLYESGYTYVCLSMSAYVRTCVRACVRVCFFLSKHCGFHPAEDGDARLSSPFLSLG